jgi:DNA recombination protein RmuC
MEVSGGAAGLLLLMGGLLVFFVLRAWRSTAELVETKTKLELERKHFEEVKQSRENELAQLKSDFKLLSIEALETQGVSMMEKNKSKIEELLKPLGTQIRDFDERIRKDEVSRTSDAATLKQLITDIGHRSDGISEEARNLTRALKGSSKTQGDWGEMVLDGLLASVGLEAGTHYEVQESVRNQEGKLLRPDVVVSLPDAQKIVIDSKVSLVAFERWANGEDEEKEPEALDEHVKSVKRHVDDLAGKDYGSLYPGTEVVLMFVPIEGAFSALLQAEQTVLTYANERGVLLTSPSTLLLALRVVENLWNVENQNRNAQEIAKRAGMLYDKFRGFANDLSKVGAKIDDASIAYASAYSKLTGGPGNLVRQTEMLREMGAPVKVELPAQLIDDSVSSEDGQG